MSAFCSCGACVPFAARPGISVLTSGRLFRDAQALVVSSSHFPGSASLPPPAFPLPTPPGGSCKFLHNGQLPGTMASTASRCGFHVKRVSRVTPRNVGISTCGTGWLFSFSETFSCVGDSVNSVLTVLHYLSPRAAQNSGTRLSSNQQKMTSPKTLDQTHPPKASDLYHTSSPDLEPTGKEKVRPPKRHLVPQSGD